MCESVFESLFQDSHNLPSPWGLDLGARGEPRARRSAVMAEGLDSESQHPILTLSSAINLMCMTLWGGGRAKPQLPPL